MECWNCGGMIDRDMLYCKHCGAELERTQQYSQSEFGNTIQREQVLDEEPLSFNERLNSSHVSFDDETLTKKNTHTSQQQTLSPRNNVAKRTVQNKKVIGKPKYNIYLLISFFLSIAYIFFIIVYFWNSIFTNVTENLMMSHCLGIILAILLNWLGLMYKQEGMMLASAILYAVSSLFYLPGAFVSLIASILCFFGYYLQYCKNRRLKRREMS